MLSPAYTLDIDRNDQGTTAKLVDAGFLVSDKFRGKNMFDFFVLACLELVILNFGCILHTNVGNQWVNMFQKSSKMLKI